MSVHTSLSPMSSFKRLLKPPPTVPATTMTTPRAPIERLPTSVIQEIGHQSDLRDVLHLSLCSRRLSRVLAPVLYATVELKTNKSCKTTLIAFAKRPDITQHVRRLIVRPNSVEWTDPGDEMDEGLVASLIARIAGRLGALEAFEWDGMEMPNDELWSALKTSCPHLKRIGTSIGENALNASSPLWDFNDLRQVSLKVKCHSLDWLAEGLPKTEKLPRKFWEMLLERSPRLEELAIGGSAPSPRMFDIRHVTAGRWPRLRSITLGDMVMIASTKGEEQARKDHAAFMAFFVAHPGLQCIVLQHAGGSVHFPGAFVLPASALPNVHTFGGPLKFVKTLPIPQRLRHLTLTSLHHTASSFPPTFAALQELRWLESLSIWVDLSFGIQVSSPGSFGYGGRTSGDSLRGYQKYDDVQVLKNLVVSRPGLKHLEVACFTRPTFSIREFSQVLRGASSLESFVLTKVHKSNEEDMTRCAARVVSENPNLRRFTLRTTHDSWFSPGGGRVRQLGVYEALEAVDGRSVSSSPVTRGTRADNLDNSSYAEEFGVLSSRAEISPSASASSTEVALLAHEWGQRSLMGKEHWKHFLQTVGPPKDNTPPSSWPGHAHGKKHGRSHSNSVNSSQQQVQAWKPRRASFSVVGSISAMWEGGKTGLASPRSSFSSSRSGVGAQGAQVTWAPSVQDKNSLGRSGSASTSASGSSSGSSSSDSNFGTRRGVLFGRSGRQKD
ncbi:hypothetical protein GALMADRAFT_225310 [Galerina marginata CBS 339.88]|uniref:F-box domain-containing protein n=1 Tax=Galerina marginata (strain CBS 339.88) TaxID=685588 RepID=A0A067TDV9_GALM3|nr:hypothetical protein GALMADRAFT_225310 [Galerina marginata CBS 339.88]